MVNNVIELRSRREYPMALLRVPPSEVRDGDVLCYDDERWTVLDTHVHRIGPGLCGFAIVTEQKPDPFVLDPRDGDVWIERRMVCEWAGRSVTIAHGLTVVECDRVAACLLWQGGACSVAMSCWQHMGDMVENSLHL